MPRCVLYSGECDGCMDCYEKLNEDYDTETETEQDDENSYM